MADVFDQITSQQPAGDIFDQVAAEPPEKNAYLRTMDTLADASGKVTDAIKTGAEGAVTMVGPALQKRAVDFNKLGAAASDIAFPQYQPVIAAARGPLIDQPEADIKRGEAELAKLKEGQPYWKQLAADVGAGFGALPGMALDVAAGRGVGTVAGLSEAMAAKQALPLGMAFFGAGEDGAQGAAKGYLSGTVLHKAGEIGQALPVFSRLGTQAGVQGVTGAALNSADAFLDGRIPTTEETLHAAATNAAIAVPFALAPGKMGVERPKDSGVRIDTKPEAAADSLHGVADRAEASPLVDRIIQAESGGDPNAQAGTSSARGLGQFVKGTRDAILKRHGVDAWSADPAEQRRATELLIEENRAFLRNALGREPSDGDVYFTHFLGTGGAEQFLSGLAENPSDAAVNHVSPAAARANHSIFYTNDGRARTNQEVYDLMAAKVAPKDGQAMPRPETPAQPGQPGPETGSPAADAWPLRPELDALRQDMEERAPGVVEGQGSPWDQRPPSARIDEAFGLDTPLGRRAELESLRQDIQGRDVTARAADEMGAPVPETEAARIGERQALPEGQGFDMVPDAMRRDRLPAKLEDAPTMPAQPGDVRWHLNEQPADAYRGITPEQAAHAVRKYVETAPDSAPVRIVQSQGELPPHLLEEYRRSGSTGAIEGVYDRGSRAVWLVADNLESKSRAGEIWLHENVAHHGLRAVFGSDKGFDAFLKRNAPHFGYGRDHIAMEEHIARMAEKMDVGQALTPQERSLWGKFVDYVRGWLVKNGWATPKTADLRALLQESLVRMTREKAGQGGEATGRVAAFSSQRDPREFRAFLEGEPVSRLRGDEFPKFKKLSQLVDVVANWWAKKYHGQVNNPEIGDVAIDRRAANYSAGHGMSPEKQAAFAAVPDIIQHGKVLSSGEKTPGSGLVGHVIGAPVEIGGKAYVGLALVREDANKRRFYVHDVYLTERLRHSQSGPLPKETPTESNAGAFKKTLSSIFAPDKTGGEGSGRFSAQGQGDYQRDRIAFDGQPREPVTERAKELKREAYRRFVDKDKPIVDLAARADSVAAQNVENQVRRLRGLGGIAEEMLAGKGALRYGIDGQETTYVPGTKSLKDILAPLKTEEQYRDYESLRAAERESALAIHRPDVRGNDQARAEFEIRRLERKYGPDGMAMLRGVSAAHRQFERDAILTPLHESGWISKEAYDAILKAPESEYYASFHREMEDVGKTAVGSRDVVRKIKGSERKVLPSTEATIANVARAVKLVETLKLHQQIVDLRNLTPDLAEGIKLYKKGGLAPRDALVTVQNGQKTYWKVPTDVARALDAFNPREANAIVQAMAIPAKMLRVGATMGLEFIARNPARDNVSAFIYSKHGYNPFTDFARGVFHTIKGEIGVGSDWYSEWRAAGGAEAFLTSLDREAVRITTKDLVGYKTGRDVLGKYVRNPLDALRAISEFGEKGTRVGAFIKAREKGATPLEAMAESRDLTLDFSRMGSDTRILNQIVAFWNANVQGTDKMFRALKERPGITLLRAGLGITLPSVLLAMHNQGQQWYEELPAWQKDYFWCFKVGNVDWGLFHDPIIRIPKPFELGILFGSLPERIVDFAYKRDPQGFKDVGRAALDALTPGWMPTAALPLVESMTNYSFFRGKPLENQSVQSLPPGMRVNSSTSEIAKRVGKLTDVSPIQLDNWFRAWTGSMGKMALDAGDLALRDPSIPPVAKTAADVPLVRGFVAREPIGSGESVDRFYKNMEEATQASQGRKALLEAGDQAGAGQYDRNAFFAPAARALSQKLSDMRAEIAGIQESPSIGSEEKRVRIDAINRQITAAAREFDEAYRTGQLTPEIRYLGERARVHEALDQYKELIQAGRADEARALVKSAGLDTKSGLVKWADARMSKAREIRKAVEDNPRLTPQQRQAYLDQADAITKQALSEFEKRIGGAR